jgi:hypothetical protein
MEGPVHVMRNEMGGARSVLRGYTAAAGAQIRAQCLTGGAHGCAGGKSRAFCRR